MHFSRTFWSRRALPFLCSLLSSPCHILLLCLFFFLFRVGCWFFIYCAPEFYFLHIFTHFLFVSSIQYVFSPNGGRLIIFRYNAHDNRSQCNFSLFTSLLYHSMFFFYIFVRSLAIVVGFACSSNFPLHIKLSMGSLFNRFLFR